MDMTSIIVACISLLGTLIGTYAGIRKSTELSNYRIQRLEEKVNRHNNLIERTYLIEQEIAVLKNRESVSEHRIEDLENE